MNLTQEQLDEVNRRRRAEGKREMTWASARARIGSEPRVSDPGFDLIGFLVGYTTGVPIGPAGVTGAAVVGALLHPSGASATESNRQEQPAETPAPPVVPEARNETPAPTYEPAPSFDPSPSPSFDSGGSFGGSSE